MKGNYFKILTVLFISIFVLSACGDSTSNGDASSSSNKSSDSESVKDVLIWDISTGKERKIVKKVTKQFNEKHDNINVEVQFFQNDPYKKKLRIAMGANKGPDIFYNWGGGVLKSYVDSGYVMDLTKEINSDPKWKGKYSEAIMQGVTFNNKIYGVPINKVQPVVFYYNKQIFNKYDLKPPETWSDLLTLVKKLKSHDVIPIALGGKQSWTLLMFHEYLVDRIGGSDVFTSILNGKEKAWSNPAVIKANKKIQKLVSMGAFEEGFISVGYSNGTANALLYTGKAAMTLMGTWGFSDILSNKPSFIKNGHLGWFPFPEVKSGSGNPTNVAGNFSNFYSINKHSDVKKAAVQYLKDAVLNDLAVKSYISLGLVPPVDNIEKQLNDAKYDKWLNFIHGLVQNANHYQLSWDQALSPEQATALLDGLEQVFLKNMTPEEFSQYMIKNSKK